MAAPGAELSRLQKIIGHASPETTSRYVHHANVELAAEHRRIERLEHDPLQVARLRSAEEVSIWLDALEPDRVPPDR